MRRILKLKSCEGLVGYPSRKMTREPFLISLGSSSVQTRPFPILEFCVVARRAFSQIRSFKIHRTTCLNYIKYVNPRILRLKNCERAGTRRTLSQFQSLKIRRSANLMLFRNVGRRILMLQNCESVRREFEDVTSYYYKYDRNEIMLWQKSLKR